MPAGSTNGAAVTGEQLELLCELYISLIRGETRAVGAPNGLGPLTALIADANGWRADGLARVRRVLLDVLLAVQSSETPVSRSVPNDTVALALGRLWGVVSPPWSPSEIERALRNGTRGLPAVPEESAPRADSIRKWERIALRRTDVLERAQEAHARWSENGVADMPPRGDWPRWDPNLDVWFSDEQQEEIASRVHDLLGHYALNAESFRSITETITHTFANSVLHIAAKKIHEYVQFEPPSSRVGNRLCKLAVGFWDEPDRARRLHREAQIAKNPSRSRPDEKYSAAVIGQMFVEDSLLRESEPLAAIIRTVEERDAMFLIVTDDRWVEDEVTRSITAEQTHQARRARTAVERFSADLERIRSALLLDPGAALALALEIARTSDRVSKIELARLYVEKREALSKFGIDAPLRHAEVSGPQARRQIAIADQSVALELLYTKTDTDLARRLAEIVRRSNTQNNYPYGVLSTDHHSAILATKRGDSYSAGYRLDQARKTLQTSEEIRADRRQALETEHQLSLATTGLLVTMIEKQLSVPREQEWPIDSTAWAGFQQRCAAALKWSFHTRRLLSEVVKAAGGSLPSVRIADGRYLSWAGWHGLTRQMHVRVLIAVVISQRLELVGPRSLDGASATLEELKQSYAELLLTEPLTPVASAHLVRQATWIALLDPEGRVPVVRDCAEQVPHLLRGDDADLSRDPEASMLLPMDESALWHRQSGDGGLLGRLPSNGRVARYLEKTRPSAWGEWRTHYELLPAG